MKTLLTLTFVFALGIAAQTPPPAAEPKAQTPPAPSAKPGIQVVPAPDKPKTYQMTIPVMDAIPITKLPPSTVLATVDGQKVTAGDLQTILLSLPAQAQQRAQSNRHELFVEYGLMQRLIKDAKKANLDQKSPWKEEISYSEMQILSQAAIAQKSEEMAVPPAEIQKFYDENKERYAQVKVKGIYLPFNSSPTSQADSHGKPLPTEEEAKAKAEDLVKQARAGADFVKLVKAESGDPTSVAKDGDFPPLRKSSAQIPEDIKKAVFSAKAGDVTEPLRQQRGFYIFRIEEVGYEPLTEVQKAIGDQLKSEHVNQWLSEMQKSVEVKVEGEATAPAPVPAAAAPAPSSSAAPSPK
jgi:peptidyl-prolyl cis-trans isomerase C